MRRTLLLALCSAGSIFSQTLISPVNNSTITNSLVVFQWSPAPATGEFYQFRITNSVTSVPELIFQATQGTNAVYTMRSGPYRLELRKCSPTCSTVSTTLFTVANRPAPGVAPTSASCQVLNENSQNRVNCSWAAVSQGDFYLAHVVQPNTGPGGGALTVAAQQAGPNSTSFLVPNGRALVVIQSCTGDGCGPVSTAFEINPAFGNPVVPILSAPISGTTIDSGAAAPGVFFAWNRVAGDPGDGSYRYHLYVLDFSRNGAALDVFTSNNFYAAYLNPMTRYDAIVAAIGPQSAVLGPAIPFLVRGRPPNAPSIVYSDVIAGGPDRSLMWTPVPDANGETANQVYQWRVTRAQTGGLVRLGLSAPGVTGAILDGRQTIPDTAFCQAGRRPPTTESYFAAVRVCMNGSSCSPQLNDGWGPWSGDPGAEGAATYFTYTGCAQY
ncbi:MAG: hypothetical protein U0Q16_39005 [Bryobacteraceae bacterium]